MTQKTTGRGQWTYVYDTDNRLIAVGYAPNGKAYKTIGNYAYDAKGARYQKIVYRYADTDYNNSDTWSLLVEQIGSPTIPAGGSITSTTTYAGSYYEAEDGRFTKRVFLGGTLVASMTVGQVSYFHNDHLGSVNVISDSTGAKRSLTEYDPFGKVSRFERSTPKVQTGWEGFNGKRLDDETGLLFYGGRYYDPKLGRFITADIVVQTPKNPQTLNRYTYCNNNPVALIDPTGHSWLSKVFKSIFHSVASVVATAIGGVFGAPYVMAAFQGNWGMVAKGGMNLLGMISGNPLFMISAGLSVAADAVNYYGMPRQLSQGLGYASLAFAVAGGVQQVANMLSRSGAAIPVGAAKASSGGAYDGAVAASSDYYRSGDLLRAFNSVQADTLSKVARAHDLIQAVQNGGNLLLKEVTLGTIRIGRFANDVLGWVGFGVALDPLTLPEGAAILALSGRVGLALGAAESAITRTWAPIVDASLEMTVGKAAGFAALKVTGQEMARFNFGASRYVAEGSPLFIKTAVGRAAVATENYADFTISDVFKTASGGE